MIRKTVKVAINILKEFFLDQNESMFAEAQKLETYNQRIEPRALLIQAPADYFYLLCFKHSLQYFKRPQQKVIGLWPYSIYLPLAKSSPIRAAISNKLRSVASYQKWSKLYKRTICHDFINTNVSSFFNLIDIYNSIQIWKKIKSKEDLVNLHIEGLKCGDLVYDTYLRYRVMPTVELNDLYLLYVIIKAKRSIKYCRKKFKKLHVETFVTSYTSYIQHGVPVRVALEQGIKTYSTANHKSLFKKLEKNDPLHTVSFDHYYSYFELLTSKEEKLELAQREIEKRFSGQLDIGLDYMRTSPYKSTGSSDLSNNQFDAVVFLHNFFDSPHCYRQMVYPDFLAWVEDTIEVIRGNNLNIAFKAHPNQSQDSADIINNLKLKYPDIKFIDSSFSNKDIFNLNIKCGFSVHGTVLHELAYHGIPSVGVGDNPHVSYPFVKTCKTKEEYRNLLRNFKTCSLPKDSKRQVLSYYYMHYIDKKELFNPPEILQKFNRYGEIPSSVLLLDSLT